jgi:hypothetical protein
MTYRLSAVVAAFGIVVWVGSFAAGPNVVSAQSAPAEGVEPGYLGVMADETGDAAGGIRLLDVLAGGPAQAAGLRAGDVITSIDGRTAAKVEDMATLLAGRPAGDEVTFVVRRGNEVRRVEVRLGKRPPPEQRRFENFGRVTPATAAAAPVPSPAPSAAAAPTTAKPNATPPEPLPVPASGAVPIASAMPPGGGGSLLGVRAVPVSPELQRALSLPEARGALVVEVRPGSPAQKAGLPLEAVITAIDGARIDSPQQLADAVNDRGYGAEVRLSYFRFGQPQEKIIRLGGGDATTVAAPPNITPKPIFQPPPTSLPVPIAPPTAATTPSPSAATASPVASNPSPIATAPTIATTPSPAVPTIKPESEAEAIKRQIRELEARLAEIENQKQAKPPAKKP